MLWDSATRIFYENSVNISLPSLWIKLNKTQGRVGNNAKSWCRMRRGIELFHFHVPLLANLSIIYGKNCKIQIWRKFYISSNKDIDPYKLCLCSSCRNSVPDSHLLLALSPFLQHICHLPVSNSSGNARFLLIRCSTDLKTSGLRSLTYLIFVIFFTQARFPGKKFTPKSAWIRTKWISRQNRINHAFWAKHTFLCKTTHWV